MGVPVSLSIGVAVAEPSFVDTEDLLARADAALYAAKAGGRDLVYIDSEVGAQRLRSSPPLSRSPKAASSFTVASTSRRSTISTGECM